MTKISKEVKTGVTLSAIVDLSIFRDEGDGWEKITTEHLIEDVSFEAVVCGVGTATYKGYENYGAKLEDDLILAQWTAGDARMKRLQISGVKILVLKALIAEARAAERAAKSDVDAFLAAKEGKEAARDKAEAERIMAIPAERVFETAQEAQAWKTRYNNINNEGGEGFVPSVTIRSEREWAQKTLEEVAA